MRPLPLVLLLLTVAGCRTAKGVYADALADESSGRYEDAARAYADALRRDPGLPNAAGRLEVAGNRAVGQRLAASRTAPTRRAAADDWLAAEALARDAQAVGVRLSLPSGFANAVADVCAEAVGEALDAGRDRAAAGDFAGALAAYDGARRYRPAPARQASLDAGARDAYSGWAAQDLAAGRFRAALAHAESGLELSPPGSAEAAAFQALAADVLSAGTVRVAVFPIAESRAARGDAPPRGLLRDASDVLLDERLATAPPFVALADPAEARRALRDSRAEIAGSARVLAGLTRRVGAQAGLVAEVAGVLYADAETARRDVAFRLRQGGTAPGVRVTTERTARLRYALVGVYADGRRLDCGPEQTATVRVRYDTATTAADPQTLRLSDADRDALSGRARDDAEADLTVRLREALATELAERVAACTAPLVP